MWQKRGLVAVLLFVVIGSTVGTTVGLGVYYRSDAYRRDVEQNLNQFFGLPVDIGGVRPHTLTARRLTQIDIWLPDRRAQVFDCPTAVWDAQGAEGHAGAAIHVHAPMLLIGADDWLRDDYMRVLRASIAHDFREMNIREVIFHQARIRWQRRDVQIGADGVEGTVTFAPDGSGEAHFIAQSLNGLPVGEPIEIRARLSPTEPEFIPEVTLTVPTLPLSGLGLDGLFHGAITQGSFAGTITVRPSASGDTVILQGAARQIPLQEVTRRLRAGPIVGQIDLSIEQARLRGRDLESVEFNGQVRELEVNSLAPYLDLPQIGGKLRLRLHNGLVRGRSIERLTATGEWTGASLEALAQAVLHRGGIRGQLRLSINSLTIESGEIAGADVDLSAVPPSGGRGTIQRDLLSHLMQQQLGLNLPDQLLPAEVEFVQIGAKIIVEGGQLRVMSLAGPAGPAMITARVFGQLVPLLGGVDQRFELRPLMERWREPLSELRTRVQRHLASPASRPAATLPVPPVRSPSR